MGQGASSLSNTPSPSPPTYTQNQLLIAAGATAAVGAVAGYVFASSSAGGAAASSAPSSAVSTTNISEQNGFVHVTPSGTTLDFSDSIFATSAVAHDGVLTVNLEREGCTDVIDLFQLGRRDSPCNSAVIRCDYSTQRDCGLALSQALLKGMEHYQVSLDIRGLPLDGTAQLCLGEVSRRGERIDTMQLVCDPQQNGRFLDNHELCPAHLNMVQVKNLTLDSFSLGGIGEGTGLKEIRHLDRLKVIFSPKSSQNGPKREVSPSGLMTAVTSFAQGLLSSNQNQNTPPPLPEVDLSIAILPPKVVVCLDFSNVQNLRPDQICTVLRKAVTDARKIHADRNDQADNIGPALEIPGFRPTLYPYKHLTFQENGAFNNQTAYLPIDRQFAERSSNVRVGVNPGIHSLGDPRLPRTLKQFKEDVDAVREEKAAANLPTDNIGPRVFIGDWECSYPYQTLHLVENWSIAGGGARA